MLFPIINFNTLNVTFQVTSDTYYLYKVDNKLIFLKNFDKF